MTAPDEARRLLAADYLRGRTLEEALAAWQADYASPAYRERWPMLAWLGNVIRKLADEAEAKEEATSARPELRRRR